MPSSYYNRRINPNRSTRKEITAYSPVEEKTVKQEIDPAIAAEVVRGALWWLDITTIAGETINMEQTQDLLEEYVMNLKNGKEPVKLAPEGYRESSSS